MKNLVKVIKKFADNTEIGILNWWSLSNFKENPHQYHDPNMDSHHPRSRFTTRLKQHQNYTNTDVKIDYPLVSYMIQDRIIKELKLDEFKFPPPFYNGIVNGIGFGKGLIEEHIDPIYYENTCTMHCNIITKKSDSGGITVIDGIEYDVDPGDLLCYPVSEVKHRVTLTRGLTNRILWVFGFCISRNKMRDVFYA